jgi:hypothetical protein
MGRKTQKNSEVLPLLYLHRLSSGDFTPVLGQFLGASVSVICLLWTMCIFGRTGSCTRGAGIEGGVRPPRWAVAEVRWELNALLPK